MFTSESLKIVALICMLIDHAGATLFPQCDILRSIGRVSFPLYAFLLAQGCKHTHSMDQVLHIAIIYGSVRIFGLDEQTRNWLTDLALTFPVEQILRYSLIFIIILDPASVFVKKLSIYVTGGTSDGHKKAPPVGSVIGKLERILTVILVLCNQIGAIGFVLTAKSLARYKQLDNQSFAEKYLVGTLSSTTIAIIAALLLK